MRKRILEARERERKNPASSVRLVPVLRYSIVQDVDWIEVLVEIDWAMFGFVKVDTRKKHVKPLEAVDGISAARLWASPEILC